MIFKWRRSEVISLGSVFLILGWVWYASAKANSWDDATKRVADEVTILGKHEVRLTSIEQQLKDQHDEMMNQLQAISEAVGARPIPVHHAGPR